MDFHLEKYYIISFNKRKKTFLQRILLLNGDILPSFFIVIGADKVLLSSDIVLVTDDDACLGMLLSI